MKLLLYTYIFYMIVHILTAESQSPDGVTKLYLHGVNIH